MSEQDRKKMNWEIVERTLGWATLLGLLLVSVWFGLYMSGAVCSLHGPMFNLTVHECELLSYSGIAIMKILVIVFLAIPWLALKIVRLVNEDRL